MQLQCSQCSRLLEFSGERPSFCAYCGHALASNAFPTTAKVESPASDPEVSLTAPANGAAPQTVGAYRLLRQLGTGGMGTVYEAEETGSGRRVAVKLLNAQAASSSEAMQRFRQEGRLASQIAHPNCVFVLAADEQEGRPYIVMELMPGTTLKDLIEKEGPLPPEQAVAKILDVIDGLQAAHQHGVIHRDVKPSNCFLVHDGRVKVGDFGLSKSLVSDAHLTRSGTFLGTPLFASPEQIKDDPPTDFRTDVYSVAATLYYLLAGQAPFQKSNPAAIMARIVADPAPPLRSVRPEVSPTLDRVVLKGLERNRDRRWRSLTEFRAALLRFMPDQLSIAGMGVRLGAYLIDEGLFLLGGLLIRTLLTSLLGDSELGLAVRLSAFAGQSLLWVGYFVWLEGAWGCSLGKRLLGLRVWRAGGSDPPRLAQVLLRTVLFFALVNLVPGLIDQTDLAKGFWWWVLLWLLPKAAGVLALVMPMRAETGYRGLHEFLSGTRVVALPRPEKRWLLLGRPQDHLTRRLDQPDALPRSLGSFLVRGALRWGPAEQVLLGEDPGLSRDVCLWLRPATAAAVGPVRRDLARPARLRWLTCGRDGERQWDAFVAPVGSPLADLVAGDRRLGWRETRLLLQQLAEELAAACADGTLPQTLTLEQVWVGPSAQAQLLDFPLKTAQPPAAVDGEDAAETAQERALALLRQVAVLALESRPRTPGGPPRSMRAPLPPHAGRILDCLLGVQEPYTQVEQLQADLAGTRTLPAEVTVAHRAAHLAVLTAILSLGLVSMFLPGFSYVALYDALAVRALPEYIALDRKAVAVAGDPGELERMLADLPPERAAELRGANDLQALVQNRLEDDVEHQNRSRQALGWVANYLELDPSAKVDELLRTMQLDPRQKQVEDFYRAASRARGSKEEADAALHENTLGTISAAIAVWPLLWVLWALVFRGGFSYSLMGIALVRGDGRRPARWQCGLRALLVWAPLALLLTLSAWLESRSGVSGMLWWSAAALLGGYVALALVFPSRSVHDQLAGTRLVPR